MIKKQILFTFDYELFLGKKSGSVKNSMVTPTEKIVNILNQYNVKGIFFVDSSYLMRLESIALIHPKAMIDYNSIKLQLNQLIKQGHYIYPHIHPHWIDAQYLPDKNEWDLSNNSKYRVNAISEEERDSHFNKALYSLSKITNMPISYFEAYRAGGWCIQPFNVFASVFKHFNISSDFSVLGGISKKGNTLNFDFKTIPQNSTPYRFENNITKEKKKRPI